MKTLDKKLRRDLAHMKGQAITIGLVMACGVAALMAALTTYDSLRWSQQTYYEAAHFPHVFVSLKRAPAALTAHLAALPGVIDVEPRVVFDVMLDVAGVAAPPIGRMIALPEHGMPRMNRLHLRQGRWVEPGHGNEVLVSEGFARAHQIRPGGRVQALLNGKYQVFEIAGVVLTPEYIFAIRSGGLLPDDRQFGVFWIAHTTLAAAFNMEGTFNDVVLRLAPGTRVPPVLEALDRLLAPYGSLGAYGRSEQMSHRFISDEIAQQGLMAATIPPVFLGVAAFLLHVVLARIVATQREQIAALKALGYDNVTIGLHYLKLVMVITLLGIAVGLTLGTWFGWEMTRSYVMFFHFPVLAFRVAPWIPLLAAGVSLVAAIFAACGGVRRVGALAPAEAMRPPVPLVYRRSLLEHLGLGQWLSPPGRMVLRNMARRPLRALLTTCGVALAVPLILLALFWRDAIAYMIAVQFSAVDRSDARVSFTDPVAIRAQRELARIPGVMYTEAFRSVPVRLRAGHRTYRTGILGLPHDARLHRLMDTALHPMPIPPEGVLLTDRLGERLGVQVGDSLRWRKRLVGLLVGAGVLALIMWMFLPTPVPVELVVVTHGPFEQTIAEDGKTRVRQRYVIAAPLAGTLERITLKVGDQVEKGAVLAVIIPSTPALLDVRTERELQERLGAAEAGRARTLALVARARAALEQAQVDAERTRKMAQQKLVSLAQVEQEQLRVTLAAREFEAATCEDHAAAHQVELARAALMRVRGEGKGGTSPGHRWEIRSPVCGRVLRVVQESAGAVSMGAPLLEVADPSELEVVIDVLTSDALKITAGAVARIDTGGDPILQGQVRLIEPGGFTKISALGVEEQRVNVVLDLVSPREQWSTLGDGYRVEAQIVTVSDNDAVKVPVSALFRAGETWWVYVATNGRATKRAVQVGARNALEAVVAQGLDVDERVIVYPSDAVQEGIRVRVW